MVMVTTAEVITDFDIGNNSGNNQVAMMMVIILMLCNMIYFGITVSIMICTIH